MPLVYACPKKYGYILLGGITFNATDVSAENQSLAVSQCDAQLEDKSLQKGKQTKCEVSFSKNTTIEQTGIIRAVYKCLKTSGNAFGGIGTQPSMNQWIKNEEYAVFIGMYRGKLFKGELKSEAYTIETNLSLFTSQKVISFRSLSELFSHVL